MKYEIKQAEFLDSDAAIVYIYFECNLRVNRKDEVF